MSFYESGKYLLYIIFYAKKEEEGKKKKKESKQTKLATIVKIWLIAK